MWWLGGGVVGIGLGLWMIAGGMWGGEARALTNCEVAPGDIALDPEEQAFLRLINEYRASRGIAPLSHSATLSRPAQWLANDYAANGYLSGHVDHSGRGPGVRLIHCGGTYGGEISLSGRTTAQGALDLWKTRAGHNADMLNGKFATIGIGHNGVVWVVDFGMGSGGTQPPTATATSTRTPRSGTPTRTVMATVTASAPAATKTVKPAATARPGVGGTAREQRYEVRAPGVTRE